MSKKISVVVTVPRLKGSPLAAAVERLKGVGLTVDTIYDKLGLVTGTIAPDLVPSLAKVEGVSTVREERAIQPVAPPK